MHDRVDGDEFHLTQNLMSQIARRTAHWCYRSCRHPAEEEHIGYTRGKIAVLDRRGWKTLRANAIGSSKRNSSA